MCDKDIKPFFKFSDQPGRRMRLEVGDIKTTDLETTSLEVTNLTLDDRKFSRGNVQINSATTVTEEMQGRVIEVTGDDYTITFPANDLPGEYIFSLGESPAAEGITIESGSNFVGVLQAPTGNVTVIDSSNINLTTSADVGDTVRILGFNNGVQAYSQDENGITFD